MGDVSAAPGAAAGPALDDELFQVERRGLEPVPDEQRHGHPRELFFIWAAALADFFSFFAGAILISLGLGVIDAALVLVAGALAGAALLGPLSVTGVRTGLPQIVYSRITFGRRGAAIGGLLTLLIAVGWFSYDCAVAVFTAKALPGINGDPPGWVQGLMLAAMVAGCIAVAVWGHRTITLFQTVQAPSFLLICAGLAIALWPRFHLGLTSSLDGGAHLATMLLGFTATFALIISWATYAADYSRYLPRGSSGWSVSLYSGAGSMTTLVACGLLGIAVQSIDPTVGLGGLAGLIENGIPLWFAWVFVVFIVIAEMSSNYMNIYTAALSGLAIGIPLRRWTAAAVVGLVGGVFALYPLFSGSFQQTYLNFLTATYVWFPAWCVVVLADFIRRRGRVSAEEASRRPRTWVEGVRWPALLTFMVGTLATLLFYNNQGFFTGVGAWIFGTQPADISSFVGVAVTVAAFLLLTRYGTRRVAARGGA
ncbi:MAG TPA: cytosine permease [Candidatus Dormibacteraeota bacterium]|nr:cytosine permease [Candidatus Dormibacteraeota bacterium]